MDIPGPVELLIIAAVILVLFGSKKLPDAARSLGRSLRIFKAETRGLHDDRETPPEARSLPPVQDGGRTVPTEPPGSPAERSEHR